MQFFFFFFFSSLFPECGQLLEFIATSNARSNDGWSIIDPAFS